MIVERSMNSSWLSNTWLVADRPGGHAVLIDTGGPAEPILAKIEELGVTVTHALCTHHHIDHVANNDLFRERLGVRICGHPEERALFGRLDQELPEGAIVETGDLRARSLHIPGHTLGQLAFVVNDERVFTGDTLFRGSVGGTRGPGHTTFRDLHHSIMEVLMKLPREMPVHPGHTEPTTIGQEWESNPFVRAWRGADPTADRPCTAMGEPATLLLRAGDYDGGTKCWVRYENGVEDVVPGSMVQDRDA
jgi:glyoxylase-like metal-dependent hydrolase (beta-lactamase superfamily II)